METLLLLLLFFGVGRVRQSWKSRADGLASTSPHGVMALLFFFWLGALGFLDFLELISSLRGCRMALVIVRKP